MWTVQSKLNRAEENKTKQQAVTGMVSIEIGKIKNQNKEI